MMDPGRDISEADLRRFREALASVPVRQGWFEWVLRQVIRVWCRAVAWELSVDGQEDLPRVDGVPGAGCVVAVAPHRAWVEPFLLVAAWPAGGARLVWLADGRTATRSRWRRWLLPRLGVIPIAANAGGPRAYAELAAMACERGCAVVIFPEVGPPSPPDRARRLSAGFAYLALRAGAPVVPVVVGGTHRIIRGSTFSLGFRPALETGDPVPELMKPAVRARAQRLTHDLGQTVAESLPERTARSDASAPAAERWRWLGSLFG